MRETHELHRRNELSSEERSQLPKIGSAGPHLSESGANRSRRERIAHLLHFIFLEQDVRRIEVTHRNPATLRDIRTIRSRGEEETVERLLQIRSRSTAARNRQRRAVVTRCVERRTL